MTASVRAERSRCLLPAVLATFCLAATVPQAVADPLILQGSTTFNRRIMEPFEAAIEAKSGQDITVIPNRTMLGIIALFEGRAHMAMLSAPLKTELATLERALPGLPVDQIKAHEISRVRIAIVVNPANTV